MKAAQSATFIYVSIAAVDCVRTKEKPKKRMAALRAAILFLGFMSSYTWRQLYIKHLAG
jgi:uncharacterized membrane protein YozB (DUF420 family)